MLLLLTDDGGDDDDDDDTVDDDDVDGGGDDCKRYDMICLISSIFNDVDTTRQDASQPRPALSSSGEPPRICLVG